MSDDDPVLEPFDARVSPEVLDQAQKIRDDLQRQWDRVEAGEAIYVGSGLTRDEWVKNMREHITSLTTSLKASGRT